VSVAERIIAISSQGTAEDRVIGGGDNRRRPDVYANRVTEMWMSFGRLVERGAVRGFNTVSRYADDLFGRTYFHKSKDVVQVLQKAKMKKETGRSPDHGDAAVYLGYIAERKGLVPPALGKKAGEGVLQEGRERLRNLLEGKVTENALVEGVAFGGFTSNWEN
jgi:hypothetical protein